MKPRRLTPPAAPRRRTRTAADGIPELNPAGIDPEVFRRVRAAATEVAGHPGRRHSVATMAKTADYTRHHFTRTFTEAAGLPPYQYVLAVRLHHAKRLLTSTTKSIALISFELGFPDPARFAQTFRNATGTTPRQYRTDTATEAAGTAP